MINDLHIPLKLVGPAAGQASRGPALAMPARHLRVGERARYSTSQAPVSLPGWTVMAVCGLALWALGIALIV